VNRRQWVYFAIFVLLLALSVHGVHFVPFWKARGLDFSNLFLFHRNCPEWPVPYGPNGARCGDPLARDLVYPPLVYWMFAWTRFLPFNIAETLWMLAIPFLVFCGVAIVEKADRKPATFRELSVFLLVFQLPMLYAMERGNNDALVVPLFCAGIAYFVSGRVFVAGALYAAACWMKVYPVIPSVVLLAALFTDPMLRRGRGRSFLKGFVAGGIVLAILLLPDSYRYVFKVLPELSSREGGFGTSSHTLFRGAASLLVKLPVLVLWVWTTRKVLTRDPILVLAAGLAISTFFANLSNDYNLVTAYPFLFLMIRRTFREGMTGLDFAMCILTFWAFVGDRTALEWIFPNRSALLLQVGWFFAFPLYLRKRYFASAEISFSSVSSI